MSRRPAHRMHRTRSARLARALPLVVFVVVIAGIAVGLRLHTSSSAATARSLPKGPRASKSSPAHAAPTAMTSNGVTASWVKAENAKPGTDAWNLSGDTSPGAISGYASQVSARAGQTVTLFASTKAASFHVEAYRMGWYGGKEGRLVWTSGTAKAVDQPSCPVSSGLNMVECHWSGSMQVGITSAWPPGDYLLKLVGSGNQQSWIPLTVTDPSSSATYVIQNSVTTWQAYNLYGGYDLYAGQDGSGGTSYAERSREVSFDRPYSFGGGAADFVGNELPLVSLAERDGLDVTYITSVDLQRDPGLLLRYRAFVSLGHDEYWSSTMRQGAADARDHGVNLMFLGANAVYRHIRFDSSPLGPDRRIICYKVASEDPLYGKDNAAVTSNWPDPPDPRPESTLIGDMYQCNTVNAAMVPVDTSSWVFTRSGLSNGDQLPHTVGTEYDRYEPGLPGPTNIQILAHSPLVCRGQSDHSDMTYYTATSGAGVFATGTNWWVSKLELGQCQGPAPDCPTPAVTTITENVLAAFGAGPAGRAHPSAPNAGDYYSSTSAPAQAPREQ